MFSRFNKALEAGRRAVTEADRAREPAIPAADTDWVKSPASPPLSLAFLCLEDTAADLTTLAEEHSSLAGRRKLRPLLIASVPELIERRIPLLCCEYIPPAADLAEAHGDKPEVIAQYQLRRLRLILRKWRAADCIFHGDEAKDLLALAGRRRDLAIKDVTFEKYIGARKRGAWFRLAGAG